MPNFLERFGKSALDRFFKEVLKKIFKRNPQKKQIEPTSKKKTGSLQGHPWRLCPPGQHFREATTVSSYEKKDGTQVRGHHRSSTCANNPFDRDQLYPEEIREIANRHFGVFQELPELTEFGKKGQAFDKSIQGWTQYWNEILSPSIPLESEVVKALIASESSFNTEASNNLKGRDRARGLMQVLDGSLPYLSDKHRELKNHFLNLDEDDMLDGNKAICAGIRWLFRKRETASAHLKRLATWEEAVAAYKSYLKDWLSFKRLPPDKEPNHKQKQANKEMERFLKYYQELKR